MEEELNSCLVIFELIGLQYFSLKTLVKDSNKKPSIVRTIFMVVLMVLMTILVVLFVTSEDLETDNQKVTAKNFITFAIQHSMNFGLILVILVSMVQSFMTTSKTKKLFLNVKEIAKLSYDEFNFTVNFKSIKKAALRRSYVLMTFFITVHFSTFFFRADSPEDVIPMLLGILPILYLLLIVYKFIFYVGMVNKQLNFVGKLLHETFKNPPPIKTIDNKNMHSLYVKPAKNCEEDHFKKLLATRKIFNLVYENGLLVNDSNGFTILIVLLDLVVALTASGYEIFVIIVGGLPVEKIPG